MTNINGKEGRAARPGLLTTCCFPVNSTGAAMADVPRKRRPPRDDDDDLDRNQGYRLPDDEDEPPRPKPRKLPIRHDDSDDDGPRRPRRVRPRSASVPTMDNRVRLIFGGV